MEGGPYGEGGSLPPNGNVATGTLQPDATQLAFGPVAGSVIPQEGMSVDDTSRPLKRTHPQDCSDHVTKCMAIEETTEVVYQISSSVLSNSSLSAEGREGRSAVISVPHASSPSDVVNEISDNLTGSTFTQPTRIPPHEFSKNNRYQEGDEGPYIVYLEGTQGNVGRMHPMAFGKLLFNTDNPQRKFIINITEAGRNRIQITFQTYRAANEFVDTQSLKGHNLAAFIPAHRISRQGVVSNIDTSLSDAEILSVVKSKVPVIRMRRMRRKTFVEGEMRLVTLQTCVFTFGGQNLPDYVSLYGMRCSVRPYVASVRQCHNCHRYNHIATQCRSRPRCVRCGGDHTAAQCQAEGARCVHCGSAHSAVDRQCPELLRQREINRLVAYNNISYRQAAENVQPMSYAAVAQGEKILVDDSSFPPLPTVSMGPLANDQSIRAGVRENYRPPRPRRVTTPYVPPPASLYYAAPSLPKQPIISNPYVLPTGGEGAMPQINPVDMTATTGFPLPQVDVSSVSNRTTFLDALVSVFLQLFEYARMSGGMSIDPVMVRTTLASALAQGGTQEINVR